MLSVLLVVGPDFYKKSFQSHDTKQDEDTFKTFPVTIGNAKVVK